MTLSPSYTKWFSSLLGVWNWKILVEIFRKKMQQRESRNMGARKQYFLISFHGRQYSLINI